MQGWPDLRIKELRVEEYFDEESNIGIILGKPSGNLVDFDLDCEEAILLAPQFLPETEMIHGRKSRPSSHYYYKPKSPLETKKYTFKGKSILEIRSTGCQTVVPPSTHPSGEQIRWQQDGKAARVSARRLLIAGGRLAAAALLAQRYPSKGSRNTFALALAGWLHRRGWEQTKIENFVVAVAQAAEDEEENKRKLVSKATKERIEKGRSATGGPTLAKLVGKDVADQVREWLGFSPTGTFHSDPTSKNGDWPKPLSKAAYCGLTGEIVKTIEPHTEADPAAILVQLLVACGSAIGSAPYCMADGAKQRANLFCLIVGKSAKSRKGTSLGRVMEVMNNADRLWAANRVVGGLSSGEGLIFAARDTVEKTKRGKQVTIDPGVKDKRTLVCEPEFSSVLRVQRREGNTLSPILRAAWDGAPLQTLTKNSPLRASGAHIGIIAHITQFELQRELSATDQANGYANRFLLVCAKRSRELPMRSDPDYAELLQLGSRLKKTWSKLRVMITFILPRRQKSCGVGVIQH